MASDGATIAWSRKQFPDPDYCGALEVISLHSRDPDVEGHQGRAVRDSQDSPGSDHGMQGRDQIGHEHRLIDTGRREAHLDALRMDVLRVEHAEASALAYAAEQP
jgi:hypothetical protein